MRHIRSILYALVLAPAVWILCGVGFTQDLTGRARDSGGVETASALLLLVLAGAAYAILIFSPISPLGPALFGLLFLGIGLWGVAGPDSYAGAWPAGVTKDGFDLSRPGYALAVLLAVPMLATALSVRRWRGYEAPELPVIGKLGRARGTAAVVGVPVAAEPTAVITTVAAPAMAEPPTEAVPTQAVPVLDGDEPTAPVGPASDDSTTTVMGAETTAGSAAPPAGEEATVEHSGDEPTVLVVGASGDEPTVTGPVAESAGVPVERSTGAPETSDQPTDVLAVEEIDEPTEAAAAETEEPTEITHADEPTDAMPTADTDEPTEITPAAQANEPAEQADEPAEAAAAVEESVGAGPDEIENEVAAEEAEDAEDTAGSLPEETVAEVVDAEPVVGPDDEPTEATHEIDPSAADEEPTESAVAVGDEPAETPTVAVGDEPTEAVTNEIARDGEPAEATARETVPADLGAPADDGEERTQLLRLPVAGTGPDPDEPTRPLERGDRTRTAAPGETTQVIFQREPVGQMTPERAARAQAAADQAARDRAAQERARQAFRDRAAQERAKEAFAERAARDAREHGEQTAVINLAAMRGQPIPGDQTQVLPGMSRNGELPGDQTQQIRGLGKPADARSQAHTTPGTTGPADDRTQLLGNPGTVEPPGDRTQVLSFPTDRANPGERTTDKQEPATRASSIIGSEQPDPGADPTTRLSSLRAAGSGTGEGTTADVGDNRRTKGVLDLERPADESADDTRRLVIPPARQPPDDEPTTRL